MLFTSNVHTLVHISFHTSLHYTKSHYTLINIQIKFASSLVLQFGHLNSAWCLRSRSYPTFNLKTYAVTVIVNSWDKSRLYYKAMCLPESLFNISLHKYVPSVQLCVLMQPDYPIFVLSHDLFVMYWIIYPPALALTKCSLKLMDLNESQGKRRWTSWCRRVLIPV